MSLRFYIKRYTLYRIICVHMRQRTIHSLVFLRKYIIRYNVHTYYIHRVGGNAEGCRTGAFFQLVLCTCTYMYNIIPTSLFRYTYVSSSSYDLETCDNGDVVVSYYTYLHITFITYSYYTRENRPTCKIV